MHILYTIYPHDLSATCFLVLLTILANIIYVTILGVNAQPCYSNAPNASLKMLQGMLNTFQLPFNFWLIFSFSSLISLLK